MIKPHVRAIIAATAISDATSNRLSSIYQYGEGSGWKSISMEVSGQAVTGYDYSMSAHFSGTMPNLYHYGESAYVEFKRSSQNKYTGYDYGSRAHFEVTVNGKNATFYDYGGSGWTEFST